MRPGSQPSSPNFANATRSSLIYPEAALLGNVLPPYVDGSTNDAIRNGAQMHELREFTRHSNIRTTELYFMLKGEKGGMGARRIQIRVPR